MTIRAKQVVAGELPHFHIGLETYDSTKLGLGPLMYQQSGVAPTDNFCGPLPIAVARPMEASTAIPYSFPWAMRWSETATDQKDWIFQADIATAAATRRLGMWEYDRLTGVLNYVGFLTVTFPGTSEAKTIRGLRMTYEKYSTGTVQVAATAVTGSDTAWLTNRCCVGNRIGFGSTDPKAITTWYEISAMASDTGITLATSAGTISAGTAYVIEDLRACMLVTSVTTNLGGLYIAKGLNRNHFTGAGGAVPAATTVDNIKACYFMKDAASGTATVGFGMGLENTISKTSRMCWILHTLANPIAIKYDIYGALTLTAGAHTGAVLVTGAGGAVTGTPSQLNNGRIANPSHGPGSGLDCIYFTTSTRIYRTAALSTIVAAQTGWVVDNMTEVPPGGTNTFAAGAGLQAIEYSSVIDRFLVMTTGAAGIRSYITQYRTDGGQIDRILFADMKQIDQGSADSSTTPTPSPLVSFFSGWIEGGMLYASRFGTTAILNQLYAIPLGADWEYVATSNGRMHTPKIATPDCKSYVSAFVNAVQVVGGATGKNLGLQPEPFRLQFRTSGIDDNSGAWTPLDDTMDLGGVAGASHIQFRVEFRMGNLLIPSRLLNWGIIYNDNGMSDHWQGSTNVGTDITNKRFGFRHAVAYGSTVPRLKCELFDAESGVSLGSDDSVTQAWTWAKSTNGGGAWGAYDSTDRANATTYVRVTPTGLADNIRVRGVLTEY